MQFKRALLATSALALFAGAQEAQAGDLYISVFGGANFLTNSSGVAFTSGLVGPNSASTTLSFASDADTGFVLGGAVGTHLDNWVKGLRAEVEVSFRRNDVGGNWRGLSDGGEGASFTTSGAIDANASTFAIMANAWYDIEMGWKVKPYVGGGVGWARTKFDGAFVTSNGTSTTYNWGFEQSGFAYQLGAGFNYEVAPDVNVGLGYRYFNGPNVDFFFSGKDNSRLKFDSDSHSVMVNLTIGIN